MAKIRALYGLHTEADAAGASWWCRSECTRVYSCDVIDEQVAWFLIKNSLASPSQLFIYALRLLPPAREGKSFPARSYTRCLPSVSVKASPNLNKRRN